uniref:Uncharacterized protein n=1 Tax=Trichobilharzia regenti TaxID=157069 RepID=A0AA85J0C9_TRIRE|nr:unnamed protein product [Trichobilharzia regenti]
MGWYVLHPTREPISQQMCSRKWRWIGHTLRTSHIRPMPKCYSNRKR